MNALEEENKKYLLDIKNALLRATPSIDMELRLAPLSFESTKLGLVPLGIIPKEPLVDKIEARAIEASPYFLGKKISTTLQIPLDIRPDVVYRTVMVTAFLGSVVQKTTSLDEKVLNIAIKLLSMLEEYAKGVAYPLQSYIFRYFCKRESIIHEKLILLLIEKFKIDIMDIEHVKGLMQMEPTTIFAQKVLERCERRIAKAAPPALDNTTFIPHCP